MSHTTLVFLFGIAFAWLAMLTAWVAALHEKRRAAMSTDGEGRK